MAGGAGAAPPPVPANRAERLCAPAPSARRSYTRGRGAARAAANRRAGRGETRQTRRSTGRGHATIGDAVMQIYRRGGVMQIIAPPARPGQGAAAAPGSCRPSPWGRVAAAWGRAAPPGPPPPLPASRRGSPRSSLSPLLPSAVGRLCLSPGSRQTAPTLAGDRRGAPRSTRGTSRVAHLGLSGLGLPVPSAGARTPLSVPVPALLRGRWGGGTLRASKAK